MYIHAHIHRDAFVCLCIHTHIKECVSIHAYIIYVYAHKLPPFNSFLNFF